MFLPVKKIKPVICFSAWALLFFATFVQAEDTLKAIRVDINGVVTNKTCVVVNNYGAGINVDLGNVPALDLNSANTHSVWAPFSIQLVRCPTDMTKATITFSGTPDPNNNLYYINTDTSTGAAKNVAVQLAQQTDNSGALLSTGSQMTVDVSPATHDGKFDLKARMITPRGKVTPGSVAAHVDFMIEYQ
jgi:minor fimbrial subunit